MYSVSDVSNLFLVAIHMLGEVSIQKKSKRYFITQIVKIVLSLIMKILTIFKHLLSIFIYEIDKIQNITNCDFTLVYYLYCKCGLKIDCSYSLLMNFHFDIQYLD